LVSRTFKRYCKKIKKIIKNVDKKILRNNICK